MKLFVNILIIFLIITGNLLSNNKKSEKPDVNFRLIPEKTSYMPGDTLKIAVPFEIQDGWHIYWENPGDAGIPTSINFILPDAIKLISTEWPAPAILKYSIFANFIFEKKVTVIYKFVIDKNYQENDFKIKGIGKWLVCKEKCIPGKGQDSTIIAIGNNGSNNPDFQKAFDSLIYMFPEDDGITIEFDGIKNHELVLRISDSGLEIRKAYYFPRSDDMFAHAADQITEESGNSYLHRVKFEKHIKKYPDEIEGVLGIVTKDEKRIYYNVDVKYTQEKQ